MIATIHIHDFKLHNQNTTVTRGIAVRLSRFGFYARKFAPEIAPESAIPKHAYNPNASHVIDYAIKKWSERRDLNPRPLHPQYSEIVYFISTQ